MKDSTTGVLRVSDKVRRIEIGTRRLSSEAFDGGVQSRFRGRGMDFDEVREYEPGDDVRAIDWNASARSGRTFVKKYREERQLTVVFVVDMSASGSLGAGPSSKREQGVEIAGTLAISALRSDHRVGLVLFTDAVETFIPPARGRAHTLRIVRDMVAFEPKGRGTHLALALRTVRERIQRRSVIVVLSDFLLGQSAMDAARLEFRALGARHDVVAIRLGDTGDRELPDVGLLTLEDVETGEVVEVDTGSAALRAKLDVATREAEARVRTMLRGSEVSLLDVDTLRPYLAALVGFFRTRGRRT
jgi:uncharacterized protein (DUF58 family)